MKQDLGNAVLLDNSTVYGAMEPTKPCRSDSSGEGVGPGAADQRLRSITLLGSFPVS